MQGKEELISELRKELRVSDVEHREILGKVHSDDSIKFLRYKSSPDRFILNLSYDKLAM